MTKTQLSELKLKAAEQVETLQNRLEAAEAAAMAALKIIERFGADDGAHHKQWVIDQVARALLAEDYDRWVAKMKDGQDGPETYDWEIGIAP